MPGGEVTRAELASWWSGRAVSAAVDGMIHTSARLLWIGINVLREACKTTNTSTIPTRVYQTIVQTSKFPVTSYGPFPTGKAIPSEYGHTPTSFPIVLTTEFPRSSTRHISPSTAFSTPSRVRPVHRRSNLNTQPLNPPDSAQVFRYVPPSPSNCSTVRFSITSCPEGRV